MTDAGRRARFLELLRFGAVGAGTTAIYGVLALALATAGWNADLASVAAYGVSTACSYVGHKMFTFGVAGGPQQLTRFLIVNGLGLAVATALPRLFVAWGLDARWGMVAACIGIPLSNYIALKRLVFADQLVAGT
jgi:putative flippase GtrA